MADPHIDPRADPVGYAQSIAPAKKYKPKAPWLSIPAASAAPDAVKAMRIRRVAREKARTSFLSDLEMARVLLLKGNADPELRAFATSSLESRK